MAFFPCGVPVLLRTCSCWNMGEFLAEPGIAILIELSVSQLVSHFGKFQKNNHFFLYHNDPPLLAPIPGGPYSGTA